MADFYIAAVIGNPKSGSTEIGKGAVCEGDSTRVGNAEGCGFGVANVFVLSPGRSALVEGGLNPGGATGRELVVAVLERDVFELEILTVIEGDETFDSWGDEGHFIGRFVFAGEVAENAGFGVEMPFAGGIEEGGMVFEMKAGLFLEVRHGVVGRGGLADGVAEEGLLLIEIDGVDQDA